MLIKKLPINIIRILKIELIIFKKTPTTNCIFLNLSTPLIEKSSLLINSELFILNLFIEVAIKLTN